MAKVRTWAGLDVHAHRTHASIIDTATGELRRQRLSCPPAELVDFLATLPGPVRAVYEAGPTGYRLARLGAERGIDLRVCAPGLIPRRPSDRVKTDARDADRLARLLAAGELSFVRVPSVEEERLRDLVRAREDLRQDLMRARHRLSKFLLRHDLRYPGPLGAWTIPHMRWLESLAFDDAPSRIVCADYLCAVGSLLQRRGVLDQALAHEAADGPFAQAICRLRAFRGIDTLSAVGISAEVGDFGRFARPTQVGDYLGLVPSEHTSDLKRRQGAITKSGPPHPRRLLVEAAWHYRHPPRIGALLERRQRGVDPRVCQVAWKAQRRLHQRWRHLRDERGKPAGQVAVACARELAAFLWEAATIQ
jgi:transposase